MTNYIQQMIRITRKDLDYAHQEAGRVFGGGKGSMAKFWALAIEIYKKHSGEVTPDK